MNEDRQHGFAREGYPGRRDFFHFLCKDAPSTNFLIAFHFSKYSSASLGTLTLTSHASCNSFSKKTRSKRRVSLHNDVAVIPIPMRTEYSNLVRGRIWSSASELYQNAARNTLEFAAEGFDWRNAADDSQMVQSPHGERIHPIHYMNIANLGFGALSCGQENRPCQAEVNSIPVRMDTEPLLPI